jgi:hypothetical protein
MSGIEDLSIPYASPLILGHRTLLNPFGQRAVAALFCLIAMRLEFLETMRAVPQTERDWLKGYRFPSNKWKIWIARYEGSRLDDHFGKCYAAQIGSVRPDKVGAEHCNVQVTTLVIGQLCAHTFFSSVIDFQGYAGIELYPLWPPASSFDMDTGDMVPIGDRDLVWLHEAFARESTPMPSTH